MNIRRIVYVSALLMFSIPQLAVAKLPMQEDSLGKMEGILDFCAQANPESASKFQQMKKVIAGDASDQELAEARKTQDYQDGYSGISENLSNVPKDKAIKACSAYLNGGK